jgi:hypothetical protein
MRDTLHTFLPDNFISSPVVPRLTYYEVCLASEDRALAGQHTGEIADLGEAFASIFDRCKVSKDRASYERRGELSRPQH